jgi:type II secretory pathway pseudopilin PulG
MSSNDQPSGFTRSEFVVVLIVIVVVVGIIAMLARGMPGASGEVALASSLTNLRKSIDAYRSEHGTLPGAQPAKPSHDACPTGVAGTGKGWPDAAGAAVAFVEQLTAYSNRRGATCSVKGDGFPYGPYVRGGELPANPVTGSSKITVVGKGDLEMRSDAEPPGGWKYDVLTGKLIADDPRFDHL